jgi:amino acid transporter
MALKDLFATKSLELLHEEMKGENRLRRVLGPVGLTSLGVGAIIGAGIFVITGRVASNDAGPGVLISFAVAGLACALAAFCYAEFASMAPVAGSAYTYAYATLGELFAWIIGWDLILEYAMSAATVASAWTNYFNKLLHVLGLPEVPSSLSNDPFSTPGAYLNLPAVLILFAVTVVLVIGIRESAASNTALVVLKVAVVVFVIIAGIGYVSIRANWFDIPYEGRKTPEQIALADAAKDHAKAEAALYRAAIDWSKDFSTASPVSLTVTTKGLSSQRTMSLAKKDEDDADLDKRAEKIKKQGMALLFSQLAAKHQNGEYAEYFAKLKTKHEEDLPTTDTDIAVAKAVLEKAREKAPELITEKWGLVGQFGINKTLEAVDDAARNNFMPYGLSGVMVGAALVFFAFIGFDSISTHSEEAVKPQRDVPIGIIASLGLCTLLYVAVAGIITGMVPYPEIDVKAAVASAFTQRAEDLQKAGGSSTILNLSGALIAAGALAGMTSVLLITFLSQARVFLAMARDGLMPRNIFGAVHHRFRTPHVSTIVTGVLMMAVAAFTPILKLEEMVNIGTLFAFVVVCSAVLILRFKRPDAHRPFKTPLVYVVAPAGIVVNLVLMFFLAPDTWLRLVVWLIIGLCVYFTFGIRHSVLRQRSAPPVLLSEPLPTDIQRLE